MIAGNTPEAGFSNWLLDDSRKLSDVHRSKAVAFAGIFLSLSSGVLWFMYMANGIAYGSILGLPGRDGDLKTFLFRAEASLVAAAILQSVGVGLIASIFIARFPAVGANLVLRLMLPLALGLLSSVLVFVSIRGG